MQLKGAATAEMENQRKVICMTCFDDAVMGMTGKRAYCSRCRKWVDIDGNEIENFDE